MSRWKDSRDDFSKQSKNLEERRRENKERTCPVCGETCKDLPHHLRNTCEENA